MIIILLNLNGMNLITFRKQSFMMPEKIKTLIWMHTFLFVIFTDLRKEYLYSNKGKQTPQILSWINYQTIKRVLNLEILLRKEAIAQ